MEEPISKNHFEELAYTVLQAINSAVPELADFHTVWDTFSTPVEKQVILYSEVFEGSKLRNEPSGTRPTFKHAGSNEKCPIDHSYSQGILNTQRTKRERKDLRHKLNAKRASKMLGASAGAPGVPRLVMKIIKHLETQVKFVSKTYGVSSFPVPVACHAPFTMKI